MGDSWVVIFDSVHNVMKAEKVLKDKGIKPVFVPIPREISADCGIALEIQKAHIDTLKAILKDNKLEPKGFLRKED